MTHETIEIDGATPMNAADRELVVKFVAPTSKERGFLVRYEATLRGVEWQCTRLRSGLENWGRHHPWCRYDATNPCNCGLAELLAETAPDAV